MLAFYEKFSKKARITEMDEKGIVIETCFDPPDGHPFVTVEVFCSLDDFRVGASFWIGDVAVEKTEESAKIANIKTREKFKLKIIGNHTETLMLVKEGYSFRQIFPGNFMKLI